MPITEQQAKANHDAYTKSMLNPVKAKLSGKFLKFDAEDRKWVPDPDSTVGKNQKQIRWDWMGHIFGPDKDGFIREIVGRVDGVLKFGQNIPKEAVSFHKRRMLGGGENVLKYEVLVEESKQAPVEQDEA